MSLRRREFVAALGGAAVWPVAGSAQQPAMPVVGYLSSGPAIGLEALRQALNESGYYERRNV
jgi:putative ABC transport system substrate-binding protein